MSNGEVCKKTWTIEKRWSERTKIDGMTNVENKTKSTDRRDRDKLECTNLQDRGIYSQCVGEGLLLYMWE